MFKYKIYGCSIMQKIGFLNPRYDKVNSSKDLSVSTEARKEHVLEGQLESDSWKHVTSDFSFCLCVQSSVIVHFFQP